MERIDKLLVARALAASRTLAQKLIESGHVDALEAGQWRTLNKVSEKFSADIELRVRKHEDQRFASRAGLKLDAALTRLELDVSALKALDIGQSTGGFTDCLLKRGCVHVTGVDVGHSQLLDHLREDPRITCVEGLNARELSVSDVDGPYQLVVMDVSFISQTLILPRIPPLCERGTRLVSLVKPQFEVGPDGIGKGGIVKNANLYQSVEQKLTTLMQSIGFRVDGYFESAIQGGDGNREFFISAMFESYPIQL